MTVTADAKKRVVLKTAKPGDTFDVQVTGGEIRLTLMKPVQQKPTRPRLVKGPKGYLVIQTDRPITHEEVRKVMDEFP
jgi:hypothetical protein